MRRDLLELVATLGDREVPVLLRRDGDRHVLSVDGRSVEVDAVQLRGGLWSVILDGRQVLVDLQARGPGGEVREVISGGFALALGLESTRARELRALGRANTAAKRGEKIRAPIAGKVVKLNVAIGDEVGAGDAVVVLEAMKMENELRAARGGVVASIDVAAGDSVDTNQSLVVLE